MPKITFSTFDEQTRPLFKSLETTKYMDQVTFSLAIFMYKSQSTINTCFYFFFH